MTVKQILQNINWPEETLVLDFETFFSTEYQMGRGKNALSIVEYITDLQFELTGLGIKIGDSGSIFTTIENISWAVKRLQNKFGKALHNVTVVSQNSKFDMLILAEKFGIYPPYTIDILDLSRYYDARMSHKLADLSKMFGLEPKGDTNQFKGQHWHQINYQDMKKYCLGDVENEYALLEILLPMLDNPAFELALARHTLALYLIPSINFDLPLAEQIKDAMDQALKDDLDKVAWVSEKYQTKKKTTIEEILRSKKFSSILQSILPEGEITPMKAGKRGLIPATAQDDEAFQLLLVHPDEKVRTLCQAKAACTSWPLHKSKLIHLINQARCSNGKTGVPLSYYAAHTGRWGGTEKVNLLNLGGKGRGRPIHPLISQVRNCLVAPDGYLFGIVDSAQIEARETAWVAHQDDLLKGFANGEDIYSQFAMELFQQKVWKPNEEEKKTPEGRTADIRRSFGKDAILGCAYGMGANTFFNRCRQNATLRPFFDSGQYDWNFVDRLIKTYRIKYANIPAFWREIEKCFRWVTKYPHESSTYEISPFAHILFYKSGSTTHIVLPSSRTLNYRHAVITKDNRIRYHWGDLWGGSITENIIQAICRDLLGYWLLECEKNDIHIVLHSYDELIGLVPEEDESYLWRMIEIMTTGPEWAAGLPLAAEGELSRRYRK